MKSCSNPNCKQSNPQAETEFHKASRARDGLQWNCKSCSRVFTEEYKKRNPGRSTEWARKNKNRVNQLNKEWRAKNKEKAARLNRENSEKFRKKYPEKVNAYVIKRNCKKSQRTLPWLTKLHFDQIEIFFDAAHKLTQEFGIKMHVDHIIPLQGKLVSGLHVPWNLQVIPALENIRKGNR